MASLMLHDFKQKIESLSVQAAQAQGAELIACVVKGHKEDALIQIIVDKPSGGINIEDCGIINKNLAAAIAKDFLPPENFSLEVSSPGLDRPLVTVRDFVRCKGKKLHFWLKEPLGLKGKKEAEGVLLEIEESAISIEVTSNQKLTLPLVSIIKGQLVI